MEYYPAGRWERFAELNRRPYPEELVRSRSLMGADLHPFLRPVRRTVQWPGMDGRDEVPLTNLDQPLFDDARATKRDLVDYFEAVSEQLLGELRDRPLSVVRALRGQRPFMQKNVPKYAPPWVKTVTIWAERSKRDVAYALCNDRRTLLWFANQRAIEYHPTLARADTHGFVQTHLVLDLDPPAKAGFDAVARVAELVRRALADAGLAGAVKTSGAKGLHVFVPLAQPARGEEIAAAMPADLIEEGRSRSLASKRCTRASAGPARVAEGQTLS